MKSQIHTFLNTYYIHKYIHAYMRTYIHTYILHILKKIRMNIYYIQYNKRYYSVHTKINISAQIEPGTAHVTYCS